MCVRGYGLPRPSTDTDKMEQRIEQVKKEHRTAFVYMCCTLKWAGKERVCCTDIIDNLIGDLDGCKKAVVFLKCLKALPQADEARVKTLVENAVQDFDLVSQFLTFLAVHLDLEGLMGQTEDRMEKGDMTEGEYLKEMNVLKTMKTAQDFGHAYAVALETLA